MTRLQGGASSGRLGWPYDAGYHNAYKLDGEDADVHQYHIDLVNIGDDQVSVQVSVRQDIRWNLLASMDPTSMQTGSTISIQGSLPRALRIDKTGCEAFTFTYGDPHADGLRWFRFVSSQVGYANHSHTKEGLLAGSYCVPTLVDFGTRLQCSFPGW
jgi:hypothetical protein